MFSFLYTKIQNFSEFSVKPNLSHITYYLAEPKSATADYLYT